MGTYRIKSNVNRPSVNNWDESWKYKWLKFRRNAFEENLINLVDFPPFPSRGTTFVMSCSLSCISNPVRTAVYSNRKEFAPEWSICFFFFTAIPFQKGRKNHLSPLKLYYFPLRRTTVNYLLMFLLWGKDTEITQCLVSKYAVNSFFYIRK